MELYEYYAQLLRLAWLRLEERFRELEVARRTPRSEAWLPIVENNWNEQNASRYASFFGENGNVIGFDESRINCVAVIESELSRIIAHHKTVAYISKVRECAFLVTTWHFSVLLLALSRLDKMILTRQ